jgi:hypothetical protein
MLYNNSNEWIYINNFFKDMRIYTTIYNQFNYYDFHLWKTLFKVQGVLPTADVSG